MKKVKEKDILQYLQHLLMLIEAGIPITQACHLLQNQAQTSEHQILFSSIYHGIHSGNGFYKTLSSHSEFHPLIIQLCAIGEIHGKLIPCLKYATEWLEKKISFRIELKQLIFYPCILFASSFFLVLILLLKVVPEFSDLFKNHLQDLPILTRSIFYLSHLTRHYGIFILLFTFGMIIMNFIRPAWFQFLKKYFNIFFFKLPLIKQYENYFCINQFTQSLFLCLQTGTPLAQALPTCLPPFLSTRWENALRPIPQLFLSGAPLYQLLAKTRLFPNDVIASIHIGEETHTLPLILKGLSRFYEKKLQLFLRRIATVSEPLLMIILGLMIGTIVVGLYLPIFKLGNTF